MYCNCGSFYLRNPITPTRLANTIKLAIWPTKEPAEAETARKMAITLLLAVKPVDLPQLQEVLAQVAAQAGSHSGALVKLIDLYQEAAKKNNVLPPASTIASSAKKAASGRNKGVSGRNKKPASPPPAAKKPAPKPATTRDDYDESRSAPRPRQACRACDGKKVRKKVDKENVMKETTVVCSHCGGSGVEPGPPKRGGRGGGRRGPYVQETEEEEDINKKTDGFLRRHGYGKWGD